MTEITWSCANPSMSSRDPVRLGQSPSIDTTTSEQNLNATSARLLSALPLKSAFLLQTRPQKQQKNDQQTVMPFNLFSDEEQEIRYFFNQMPLPCQKPSCGRWTPPHLCHQPYRMRFREDRQILLQLDL